MVLSATINRYATATVVPGGSSFRVRSVDYDQSVTYGIDDPFVYDGQLDLAKGVIDHFRRREKLGDGFEVTLHNDAPPGSGLGSSSAVTVALGGIVLWSAHNMARIGPQTRTTVPAEWTAEETLDSPVPVL